MTKPQLLHVQNGELSQPFENKRKLINTNLSIICPSDTWGRVRMAFFWCYDLAKDQYLYSELYMCNLYVCKKTEQIILVEESKQCFDWRLVIQKLDKL